MIQTRPQFVLGFAALAEQIPEIVGEPLENEHHDPASGDTHQRTTTGLMVWRKADNWTAFTDGYRTWINGPRGLESRLNTERLPWEPDYRPPETPANNVIAVLPVEPRNALETRALSEITLIAVHWSAGYYRDGYDPLAAYVAEARDHIARDWGGGARGFGLMYHERISRDGRLWITRPPEHVVWAVTRANRIAYNVGLDAGPNCEPTEAQVATLERRLPELGARYGVARGATWGHGELTQYSNFTACPGPRLLACVRAYRGA